MIKKLMTFIICITISAGMQGQISILSNDKYEAYHMETTSIDYPNIAKQLNQKSLSTLTLEIFGKKNNLIIKPTSVVSSSLAKKYPNIKTYKAYNKDGSINGRLTIGNHGMHAQLYTDNGLVAINPTYTDNKMHTIELGKNPNQVIPACKVGGGHEEHVSGAEDAYNYKTNEESNGDIKRTYSMAIVTTYEFYTRTGRTEESTTEAAVAAVNAISEIYENELAANFTVLPPKVFTTTDDPFDPNDSRPDQANDAVFDYFDFDEFDIGHVLNASGGGWPGGGVTNLRILCDGTNANNSFKGGGWSGSYVRLDFDFINTFAHEVGHMFGATHTWNGTGGGCNAQGQHPGPNAFEIGSGSTIMSYQGLCSPNQNTPRANDHYFHSSSIFKAVQTMKIVKSRCVQLIEEETGNEPPQVDANQCDVNNIKIPLGTPFFIKGAVTDDNGLDDLSYSWEQYDSGGSPAQGLIGDEAAQSGSAPLFRFFNPSQSPIRYFPEIGLTLNDRTDNFQVLPQVSRQMDFKLVARDNHPGSGGVGIDGVGIRTSEFGPFEITSLNDSRFNLGDQMTITWDTNGSEETCENLAIMISYNSGTSFDFKLAGEIPYADGEATIDIPENVVTTTFAMLMLACDDNECIRFYDLYNGPVRFGTSCATKPSTICDTTPVDADQGSINLDLAPEVIISNNLITANSSSCNPPGFQNSSTDYTFMALDQNNIIRATSPEGDFRFLIGGSYRVFGISYKSGEPSPPTVLDPGTWIGQPLDAIINSNSCAMLSDNFIEVEISGNQPCGLTYDIGPTVPGWRTKRCLFQVGYDEQLRDSEAFIVENLVKGRKYRFDFCEGYSEDVFEARVIVQEYDEEMGAIGNVIWDDTGCAHEFKLDQESSFDDILIIVTDNNDCQSTSSNLANGNPTFRCAVGRDIVEGEDETINDAYAIGSNTQTHPRATVFPNPASNVLNVVVENLDTYTVNITNLTGALISQYSTTSKVDISGLPDGLYLVHIQNESANYSKVEKFVVLK